MKFILYLLLNITIFSSIAEDWTSNTFSTVNIVDNMLLPDGSIYSNFIQTGQGTSNLGKYSVSNCSGNRLDKKGKLLELIVFCETELDDGNKFWTKVSRSSGDSDVGISKFIFLGGTNEFAELKGKECTYAVSYFKDKIFGNNRCKIGKDLFEKLKK